jgi:hypothetical protein
MIGYQNWKESEYLVTSLSLDPLNPRLPEIDKKLSQKELIEELIKHEDVYEIAKSISEDGYYPVERLICVKEDNKKYIVEGNRRLAALKLLISPESAPDGEQKKYRTLSNSISLEQIKKVKVTIAPDRKSANHYIRNKHTSPTVRPWKPIQQAKFYKNMIASGSTIADISKEYMVSVGEITENLQLLDMYNIACGIKLPDGVKEFVLDSRRFPVSTLQRAFQNQEIKRFLGIDFDSNKKLVGKVNKEEFIKGYAKLVIDIVNQDLDSRIINKEADVKSYLNKIKGYKPNLSRKDEFYINDLVDGEKKTKITSNSGKDAAKKKTKRSTSLISSDFRCTVENERIKSIFKELRKLKVEDYINSVAILLRVLLELSLAHYLDETGKIQEVRKDLQKKNPRKQYHVDYYPTLSEILDYVLYVDSNISDLNTQARKALMKLVSARETIYDKDFLDLFVHNKFVMPSEPQLRTFWEQLMPIFAVTLKEPSN